MVQHFLLPTIDVHRKRETKTEKFKRRSKNACKKAEKIHEEKVMNELRRDTYDLCCSKCKYLKCFVAQH